MEILNIRVLRGPNYWSNTRNKLILLKLDLGKFEELPSNQIKGFSDQLKYLIPSLYNHFCSEKNEGGFFHRLEQGTWLGHVLEHVALELQWLAGMPCGFGRTRAAAEKGVYHVVFAYEIEEAGLYAATAAFEIIKHLAYHQPYPSILHHVQELKNIAAREGFGPSTQSILDEAKKRNIPYMRLDDHSLIMLGYGSCQKLVCATMTSFTTCIGVDNAMDKEKTKKLLQSEFLPVPRGDIIQKQEELGEVIKKIGFPCVIKPVDGNHGRGITTNINNKEKAYAAFALAKSISDRIIVEKFIQGDDFRFLVINYKLVAVAKRTPAMIEGNGVFTARELIGLVNQDPNRGECHEKMLTSIKIDQSTISLLAEQEFDLDSIIPTGKIIYLKHTANISTGGTATDVTDLVHPKTRFIAERVARLMHLDICGIDVVADHIDQPLTEKNAAILEVNSGPGFRMHLAPECGKGRNVAAPVLDMLFPAGTSARIPLVAITGTNGKTTTARLIAYLAQKAGHAVGLTTTEGIYIDGEEVYRGDCSGPSSAGLILRDPLVNYAVLECARGGILRSGLGFDHCSISVITTISEDHLGLDDIHTLDELARVKEVVARSTLTDGYAILNADDDRVYQMKDNLSCHIALFSLSDRNERITNHCAQGGTAIFLSNNHFILQKGQQVTDVGNISFFPISFEGKATCMIQNLMPAILSGYLSGFKLQDIAKWLQEFHPSPEQLPGRMNIYQFEHCQVMVDYGHNEEAFLRLQEFIRQLPAHKKMGIIAATGDRRAADIRKLGSYAAQIFDEIIIRHDEDGRGRSNEELTHYLLEGIESVHHEKEFPVRVISNELDALHYALKEAVQDTFIFYFPEDVMAATTYLKKLHAKMYQSQSILN